VAPPELLKIAEIFNQQLFMGAIAQGQSAQTCFIDFVGAVIRNELF